MYALIKLGRELAARRGGCATRAVTAVGRGSAVAQFCAAIDPLCALRVAHNWSQRAVTGARSTTPPAKTKPLPSPPQPAPYISPLVPTLDTCVLKLTYEYCMALLYPMFCQISVALPTTRLPKVVHRRCLLFHKLNNIIYGH